MTATNNSNILNFTTRNLSNLPKPTNGKSKEMTDTKVRNLKAEISPAGTISFWFRGQRDGRRYPIHIGHFPAITPEEARRTALEYKAQLDRGEDPTAPRRAQKAEPTLAEFFLEYAKDAEARGKKSIGADRNRFAHRLAEKFGSRKLGSISKKEISQYHAGLLAELSPASCNRILVLLSAIFKRAIDWEVTPSNPCAGIKQHPERNARTRFLDEAEMATFVTACRADENQTAADLLIGLLLCGMRKSELKDARWEDVNLGRGEVLLKDTKNGDSRVVLISDDMKAHLAGLSSRDKSPWLFPGRNGKKPLNNADKPFQRIAARAGLAGTEFTIHTLRHTFASWLAINGFSLVIIGKALGHRSQAMTARYSHLNDDVMKRAASSVGRMVCQAQSAINDAGAPAQVEEATAA